MRNNKKISAFVFLVIHVFSVFYPGVSYALTSGPTAPESSQFQAASVTNLVDPTSGDFSYNIPLMDVDGYPLNIAYNSGGGMDDEASWVGYGWNINPGSVSRVMKGIPDDFNGKDLIQKKYNVRPDITGGITFNAGLEVFGLDFLGANASADIFYNNQRGLGVEIGAGISASLSTAKAVGGEYTAGLSAGGSAGITSNSQTGADFNFGANMGISLKDKENAGGSMGLRFGGSLNSRAGMKSTTLSASFNTSKSESEEDKKIRLEDNKNDGTNIQAPGEGSASMASSSATTNYGMAFTPTITMPMKNQSYSLSPQAGAEFWGFQPMGQLTGHYSKQSLQSKERTFPAYGFLHSVAGRNDPHALLDFNREKDVPYMETTPTLSVPYVTQDVFTATSHLGSSQFKAVSNSTGVFFDSYSENTTDNFSLGIEFGAGGGIKGGADINGSGSSTATTRWTRNNDFLQNGNFESATGTDGEDAYFKLVGEKTSINKEYLNKIADKTPVRVQTANVDDEAKAFSTLVSNNNAYPVSTPITRNKREPRGEVFAHLTGTQANKFALDKTIKDYNELPANGGLACNDGAFGSPKQGGISRVTGTHKPHHISEIKLTKNDGMRLVYGVPVYNNEQVDVTMSVGNRPDANNMVNYSDADASTGNSKGIDHYFSQETIPSYATSFLLSGICSPDYVDVSGNGISDDDLGSAVKFNYSRVNSQYRWRTPNASGRVNYANFSEGNKSAAAKDDKASFSYGSKELWYAHSIESKNMIAVFRLGSRNDGFGYNKEGVLDLSSSQRKLDRIDLYTKAEILNNPTNPTPIKSVHFEYDYSLFGNVPNNNAGGGKLTLKSIYFTYANSLSGKENRYYFKYNASGNFEYQQYDRWGTYKSKDWNNAIAGVSMDNNEFPYSVQDQAKADEAVKKWQLSEIELPSGGKINVEYESDDYAYVQNQRAMQMAKIVGYGTPTGLTGYEKTNKIYIQLPEACASDANLKTDYFEGIDQLYFKTKVKLVNDAQSDELISGYAKITSVRLHSSTIAEVTLENRGDYHPIAAAAWQFLRQNLPQLAYPYDVDETLGPLAFVKALIAAIRNVGELLTPFETKAIRQGFASQIIPNQGFARIVNKYKKLGGGLRVKKILMNDIWNDMVGGANGQSSTTGMQFEYTKKYKTAQGTEIDISSGVASYEPAAGGEENPFRQPITYQQKAHLTSSIYTVEEPLGESYFPSASVVYSEVTIRNLDVTGAVVANGYSRKKFYTAKDFPTIVRRTDLAKDKYNQTSIFGLFDVDQGNSVVLSQGFYVETNDMHGKPVSDETFDGSGKLLSGSYTHYKSSGTEQLSLDNNALTLQPDGTVKNEVIGQEFEMYTDMREQITENAGVTMNINLDVLFFAIVVIPIPTFLPLTQSSFSGYQASSTIKVVNKYAIADKVTTIENGSTMTSENILWDALTGQVLLSKTQNGFDDPLYNFSLPAYLVNEYEKGMGSAYKNTGIIFNNVTVSGGQLPSSMTNFIVPGDELGVEGTGDLVWAMKLPNSEIRLINKDGSMYTGTSNLIMIRSGRRNMMATSSYSVVSLKNPIRNGRIEIDQSSEVLSTSAGTFSDEWTADVNSFTCVNNVGRASISSNKPSDSKKFIPVSNFNYSYLLNAETKKKISDITASMKNADLKDLTTVKQFNERKLNSRNSQTKDNSDCLAFNNYQFSQETCDGSSSPAMRVTGYAPFPSNYVVTFTFTAFFTNGYTETQTAFLTANHLTDVACFSGSGGNGGVNIVYNGMTCQELPPLDPCLASSYTIYGTNTANGYCIFGSYNGSINDFPVGLNVNFAITAECSGGPEPTGINFDSDHLTAFTCINASNCTLFIDPSPNCTGGGGNNCGPCDTSSYTITKGTYYGQSGPHSSVAWVNAVYNRCSTLFPPNKNAVLSFSILSANGTVCQTKNITINSLNTSGGIQFGEGFGSGCWADVDNTGTSIVFNGISGSACPKPPCCPPPVNQRINPYYTGLKGNWRGKQSYAYTTDRDARPDPNNLAKNPTNTRKGGILAQFTAFYKIQNGKFAANYQGDSKWIASATVTKVNSKGQEVENMDALNKFSAAQFGFNDLVTTAVGSNTHNYEIGYDGFEDYAYNNSCSPTPGIVNPCTEQGHFNFKRALSVANGNGISISGMEAHTGNYSLLVSDPKGAYTNRLLRNNYNELPKFSFNTSNEMILGEGGMLETFKAVEGQKYVVSGWIKGDVASASDPENLTKSKIVVEGWSDDQDGSAVFYSAIATKAGPKVEGWTRVMTTFEIPLGAAGPVGGFVKIKLIPGTGQTAYFDDIRIHPFNSNMKSFAYDYRTSRLMAELDENNYATFFEYNDEGQLLRNKKETEKGIVTLKETRSRVRKNVRIP
jgi:hypothetical protein